MTSQAVIVIELEYEVGLGPSPRAFAEDVKRFDGDKPRALTQTTNSIGVPSSFQFAFLFDIVRPQSSPIIEHGTERLS